MTVAIIVVSLLLFFVTIYFLRRERGLFPDNNVVDMPEETLISSVKEFLRREKAESFGVGINPAALMHTIRKEKREIDKKVNGDRPLSDAEKWFYENYYLAYRYVYSKKDSLRDLPHVQNVPRIVAIAKMIVNGSLKGISLERVRKVIGAIDFGDNFTYAEWEGFENAFSYAILEQIYILAKRLLKQEQYKKYAYRRRFEEKYLSVATYVYTLYRSKCQPEYVLNVLKKKGFDEKRANFEYNAVIAKNAEMAKTLFTALREVKEYLPGKIGFRYLSAFRVLNENKSLENLSVDTQKSYFQIIQTVARSASVTEEYCAETAIKLAKESDMDVSVVLYDHKKELMKAVKTNRTRRLRGKNTKAAQRIYVFSIFSIPIAASVCLSVFFDVAFGLLSFIPLFFVAENVVNYLLSQFKRERHVPRCNYKTVPYQHRLAIVVSEFISSFNQFKDSLLHAERIYEGNGGENVEVILLVDTPGGNKAISDLDVEIKDYMNRCEENNGVCVFIRKKTNNNGKYVAKERKRGAILAVNRLFVTGDKDDFYLLKGKYFLPEYVLTLDADNELLPGESVELVNRMAHPYHENVDLMACHSRYNLFSVRTPFSARFLSESGCETYPDYTGLYYDLFLRDLYCGKGIYRVRRFFNATDDVFPSKKILSHDLLEGSVLKTQAGTTVFEDAPQSFLADRERKKRWMRGDVQLLPFLFGRWKNDKNERYKVKIEPINRFVMAKNVIAIFKEPLLAACLLYGVFRSPVLLAASGILFLLPYAVELLKALRRIGAGDLIRHVIKDVGKNLFKAIEDIFMLPYYAVSNTWLFVKTTVKMATKSDLLIWKTFYNSQKQRDFSSYIREFSPNLVFLTVLTAIICYFVPVVGVFVGIYGLVSAIVPIELYLSSKEKSKKLQSESTRLAVRRYAEKTYRFFSHMDSFGDLIPDNLQTKPYKGAAEMTSPTNIGYAMIAKICAYELGLLSKEECIHSLSKTIDAVEKLPKWKGNLYNWYSARKREPMGQFVSSVDEGNFLACLIVTKEFFAKSEDAVMSLKCDLLLKNTDLSALFDDNKNLFYLGYDGEKYVGHYDLLNSESRLLSYVYIAYCGNPDHYRTLTRDYTSLGGNTLLSWSGTAFEALMPELFVDSPNFSLFSDTIKNTVKAQMRRKYRGIWGISESGYYNFDENQRYRYQAFGIDELALRSEKERGVVSPYSSIMALSFTGSVVENCREIEKKGGLGEYGFYEAIDCERGNRIIYQYMAHHQGMALVSMTNFLKDNVIKSYFMNDKKISSILSILNETTPKVKFSLKTLEKVNKRYTREEMYYKKIDKIEQYFHAFPLSDGNYSLFYNALGENFTKCGRVFLNRFRKEYFGKEGAQFVIFDGKERYSPTFLPFAKSEESHFFSCSYSGEEVSFYNAKKQCGLTASILNGMDGEVFRLACGEGKRVFFHSSVCLDLRDAFESHPAFSGLFTEALLFEDVLVIKKRDKSEKKNDFCVAVRLFGVKNVRWECNDMNFIGRNRDLSCAKIFDKYDTPVDVSASYTGGKSPTYPSLGDVLYPCIGFTALTSEESCQVVIMAGDDEKKLVERIRALPEDPYAFSRYAPDKTVISQPSVDVLGELLYRPYEKKQLVPYIYEKSDGFFRATKGKKLLVYTYSDKTPEYFEKFLWSLSEWKMLSLSISIGILYEQAPDEWTKRFVNKALSDFDVKDPVFYYRSADAEKIAFVLFRPDMTFQRAKLPEIPLRSNESKCPTEEKGIEELYLSGCGGFDLTDRYVYHTPEPSGKPYSAVIAGKKGGFLVTDNGSGYFYFGNSRENKSSRFDNDPVCSTVSETLLLETSEGRARINDGNGCGSQMIFDGTECTIFHSYDGIFAKTDYYLIADGAVRCLEVTISDPLQKEYALHYTFTPCLDWSYDPDFLTWKSEGGRFTVLNVKNGRKLFAVVFTEGFEETVFDEKSFYPFFRATSFDDGKIIVAFSEDRAIINDLTKDLVDIERVRRREAMKKVLSGIEVVAPERSLSLLTKYLPHQVLSARLNGKLGFYQVGGATGFRDQLQDAVSMLHSDPSICREQILSCCRHQYREGDVMHWWHEPKFGLRTTISDDKLFLPLACAEYVAFTNDFTVLKQKEPFLLSDPLKVGEQTRYEDPPFSTDSYSVFEHCLRAIRSAMKFGPHGLVTMGGGDWNDGMDRVGAEGGGESVFSSMLLYEVLQKFSPLCDESIGKELLRLSAELKEKINRYAFEEDRYKRLFTDDGRWLGSKYSPTLRLDLLVQSYAVLSGVCDEDKTNIVLDTAKSLVEREGGLIKLLDPPLDANEYLGYISAYPSGIRENGGMYTHAAMWYLIALTKAGRQDEAYELLQMINPIEKCRDPRKNAIYMGEPYVFPGDVYANEQNYGQAGWTWYTGSAGWAYRLIVEWFLGLTRRGDQLVIAPHLPKKMDGTIVYYRTKNKDVCIEYRVDAGAIVEKKLPDPVVVALSGTKREKITITG